MELTAAEEYAAFGPWVDEVPDAGQVPRVFRSHLIDFGQASLVLKIPRDVPRRDAHPGMDLYEALVIVDASATTVLTRDGSSFAARSVSHGSLVAVSNSSDLLDGRLELVVSDGPPLVIGYNGSSQQNLERLVRLLRGFAPAPRAGVLAVPFPVLAPTGASVASVASASGVRQPDARADAPRDVPVLGPAGQDYGLLSEWWALLAREPELSSVFERVSGYPARVVAPIDGGLTRALHRVRPMLLQGAIVGETPTEVHLVHRRAWLHRSTKEDLSIAHTVIFRHAVAAYDVAPHPKYADTTTLRVTPAPAAAPAGAAAPPLELHVPTPRP